MGFLKRLGDLFAGKPPLSQNRFLPLYVYSRRCREPIKGQLDLMNELSAADDSDAVWYARKVLHSSGKGRCFDQVEVELWLDGNHKPLRHEVTGGRWLSAAEYDEALAEVAAREQAEREAIEAAQPVRPPAEDQYPNPK